MRKTESIFSLTSSPLRLPWPIGRGSILLVFAFVLSFLTACSGDDSTSGNDVESSDDSYSHEASSSSVGSSSSFSEESSSSVVSPESSSSPVSSSSVVQSSSSIVAVPCKTETEDNCKYGTLVDERDGQTYRTVVIGGQEWMAENLNYAYLQPTATLDSSSWCYDNDPENCKKYGRLYLWSAAMDSAALFSKDGMGCGLSRSHALCEGHRDCPTCYGNGDMFARGVCPEKWKMPTLQEFEELFEVIGKKTDSLKSTTGWEEGLNGSDHYGFNVLPSGFRVEGVFDYDTQDSSFFWGMGKATFFWTTHRYGDSFASSMEFVEYDDYDEALLEFPVEANAVRCIKHE